LAVQGYAPVAAGIKASIAAMSISTAPAKYAQKPDRALNTYLAKL